MNGVGVHCAVFKGDLVSLLVVQFPVMYLHFFGWPGLVFRWVFVFNLFYKAPWCRPQRGVQ
ncbi:hypothetical protein A2U01_0076817, partial [Trifolium medium]|nr:hypothetical protein [Trifolium medium]